MLTVAFDVDGTLIHQAGELCDTPRYDVIALFKQLESLGCLMVIWSGGGVDYARQWAQRLGLSATIMAKGSMVPDLAVDDMAHAPEFNLGRVNLKV